MSCDCLSDGFCPRYGREMRGRFRQICGGTNVDIGTAAAFRLQWQREAPKPVTTPRKLLLKTSQAPGDAVVLTAAIYSLHKAHPGAYVTSIESAYPEVFAGYPDCGGEPLEMHYPAVHDSNTRGIHFMQAWCEFLSFVLEVPVPLLTNRPHLPGKPVTGDYWVVCSGGKKDFTNKIWPKYQEVISGTSVPWVQVGVDQAPLRGVDCRVGRTSLSELFSLVAGSRGVLCGVSLLMHVAAAFEKPAIVIAGGREPATWNCYPKQHYIHTIGQLDCCSSGGCWKARVKPLGDSTTLDASLCKYPVGDTPKCMQLISTEKIIKLVKELNSYYS